MGAGLPVTAGSVGERSLVSTSLVLSATKPTASGLKVAAPVDEQLAWLRSFQMTAMADRLPVESLRFETTSGSLRPDSRQLRDGSVADPADEIAAFRFLR